MNFRAIVTAAALSLGMVGPVFAGCDIKDEDKQGVCVDKCFFEYVSVKNRFSSTPESIEKAKEAKGACYQKCGCEPASVKE
ncbi:hypothetical protein IY145_16785 [Methylosinus sp. H3A]|jgi:hypothetical protein|uniref:hypothetical protein n=1 Tax=Methylosinus sp. H3A TaxID=2785786 RepID=UPI0018C2E32B|nr:hypothetical protein [Methylosinus sp. H3A]MBG0811028.1 hypothetical protein [Methylosinus sp. H3A]